MKAAKAIATMMGRLNIRIEEEAGGSRGGEGNERQFRKLTHISILGTESILRDKSPYLSLYRHINHLRHLFSLLISIGDTST